MPVKNLLLTLLLTFFTFPLYGRDTVINISPYSYGEIIIPYNLQNTNINKWYEDTITFSSGTKIAYMELNQMITRNYLAYGGLVFIDTVSSVYYKFNESLGKYNGIDTLNLSQGMYSATINNPDTIWNEAMHFPDSLAPCDTFVYGLYGSRDDVICSKARCIYKIYSTYVDNYTYHTKNEEGYNSILYVRDLNNVHLKIQIYVFKTVEKQNMNTDTFPDTIKVLWAADSCGNGIFKHEPVSNKYNLSNKIEEKTNTILLSKLNGISYLILSNVLNKNEEFQINIYNVKGKRIFQKHIRYSNPLDLSRFNSGIYLVHIITDEKNIIRNFILYK